MGYDVTFLAVTTLAVAFLRFSSHLTAGGGWEDMTASLFFFFSGVTAKHNDLYPGPRCHNCVYSNLIWQCRHPAVLAGPLIMGGMVDGEMDSGPGVLGVIWGLLLLLLDTVGSWLSRKLTGI